MTATSRDMVKALDRHYLGPPGSRDADSHACWTELQHPTSGRRIDYLALGLWGNRGTRLDGHEIKVSRADWLTELAKPAKAESWWSVCNRWWLVVPDESIVQGDELPDGWGLMVPPTAANRRSFKVVVKPTVRDVPPPLWLMRTLIKRDRYAAADQLQRDVMQARWDGHDEGKKAAYAEQQRRDGKVLTPDMEERLGLLERIEIELGRTVERYVGRDADKINPETAAIALQLAHAIGAPGGHGQLVHRMDTMLRYIDAIVDGAAELRKARTALDRLRTKEPAA